MIKSKFLAGLVATLITLILLIAIVSFLVIKFDMDAANNTMTYGLAFGSIAVWGGLYKWLKKKDSEDSQDNGSYSGGNLPPRHS